MARPSEIETKTVSIRLPMHQYISLLEEAYEHKVSMSELLLLKIYKPEKPQETKESGKGKESDIVENKEETRKKYKPKLIRESSKFEMADNEFKRNKKVYGLKMGDISDIKLKQKITSQNGLYELRYPKQGRVQLWKVRE